MPHEIYLDANATTHVLPAAIAAACAAMADNFGNPSSTHAAGLRAKDLLDTVRQRAARVVGAGTGQLIFLSGATEGIQTAVLSALCHLREQRQQGRPTGRLLVYGATEHKAVPQALAHWNQLLGLGLELRTLPVDTSGRHDLATLATWLPDTALLCTMAANNETGVTSDIAGIDALLQQAASPALWLVDCVQALGKLPLDLCRTRIDYAPFSGHKLYAPKGVGMLYVRHGSPYTALMAGGGQEMGQRSGTENMAGIAALGAVLEALETGGTFATPATLAGYRQRLADNLRAAFPGLVFNAPLALSLPTTLNFAVPGVTSKRMLDLLDAAGLRVSAGSACSSAKEAPSYVLEAMGLPEWQTTAAVRLSIGALTSAALVEQACAAIARCGAVQQACMQAPATEALPLNTPTTTVANDTLDLPWQALEAFLQQHPQTVLVDVREVYEHQAGEVLQCAGTAAVNVPLSRMAEALTQWQGQTDRPVVFFCRSGKRSLQAAQALRHSGHPWVRHLAGGLALRPQR